MIPPLSDAILLGSVSTEQGYGHGAMNGPHRCAMGSAFFAIGVQPVSNLQGLQLLSVYWPWTNNVVECPVTMQGHSSTVEKGTRDTVFSLIWMLNDLAKWTRPQIAEWVRSIEPIDNLSPALPAALGMEVSA